MIRSLATLFPAHQVRFGFGTILIAHVMFQVSFVAIVVRARIRDFDWTLEQAARGTALLSFALSIDDFIITFFNAGSTVTFPLQIFGAARGRLPPQIHVLATLILLVSVALLVLESRRRRGLGG